jgi:hypothetical protein
LSDHCNTAHQQPSLFFEVNATFAVKQAVKLPKSIKDHHKQLRRFPLSTQGECCVGKGYSCGDDKKILDPHATLGLDFDKEVNEALTPFNADRCELRY